MLPKDANNPQNLETVAVVDTPYKTKKLLITIAVTLGIAALLVYIWDPEFVTWMTGSTKR
jgi:hypothetical protein